MITKYALPAFVVGAAMAGPANALEYETVIEHPNGDISAIYSGAASIETREVGTAPIPGRRNNKRCIYSVSLTVDRNATVGSKLVMSRSMSSDDVVSGSVQGRCALRDNWIESLVENKQDDLNAAFLAVVEKDKALLVNEVSDARKNVDVRISS